MPPAPRPIRRRPAAPSASGAVTSRSQIAEEKKSPRGAALSGSGNEADASALDSRGGRGRLPLGPLSLGKADPAIDFVLNRLGSLVDADRRLTALGTRLRVSPFSILPAERAVPPLTTTKRQRERRRDVPADGGDDGGGGLSESSSDEESAKDGHRGHRGHGDHGITASSVVSQSAPPLSTSSSTSAALSRLPRSAASYSTCECLLDLEPYRVEVATAAVGAAAGYQAKRRRLLATRMMVAADGDNAARNEESAAIMSAVLSEALTSCSTAFAAALRFPAAMRPDFRSDDAASGLSGGLPWAMSAVNDIDRLRRFGQRHAQLAAAAKSPSRFLAALASTGTSTMSMSLPLSDASTPPSPSRRFPSLTIAALEDGLKGTLASRLMASADLRGHDGPRIFPRIRASAVIYPQHDADRVAVATALLRNLETTTLSAATVTAAPAVGWPPFLRLLRSQVRSHASRFLVARPTSQAARVVGPTTTPTTVCAPDSGSSVIGLISGGAGATAAAGSSSGVPIGRRLSLQLTDVPAALFASPSQCHQLLLHLVGTAGDKSSAAGRDASSSSVKAASSLRLPGLLHALGTCGAAASRGDANSPTNGALSATSATSYNTEAATKELDDLCHDPSLLRYELLVFPSCVGSPSPAAAAFARNTPISSTTEYPPYPVTAPWQLFQLLFDPDSACDVCHGADSARLPFPYHDAALSAAGGGSGRHNASSSSSTAALSTTTTPLVEGSPSTTTTNAASFYRHVVAACETSWAAVLMAAPASGEERSDNDLPSHHDALPSSWARWNPTRHRIVNTSAASSSDWIGCGGVEEGEAASIRDDVGATTAPSDDVVVARPRGRAPQRYPVLPFGVVVATVVGVSLASSTSSHAEGAAAAANSAGFVVAVVELSEDTKTSCGY